jgi:hypothetical protein
MVMKEGHRRVTQENDAKQVGDKAEEVRWEVDRQT